jgi:hypothetical protein
VSSPIWASWPDIYYCLTVTVLFLWGALSDERGLAAWDTRYIASGRTQRKHHFLNFLGVDLVVHKCVYRTVTEQRAWHGPTENAACNISSIVAGRVSLLRVYGPLPSNGCFSTSTVLALSKYATICSYASNETNHAAIHVKKQAVIHIIYPNSDLITK